MAPARRVLFGEIGTLRQVTHHSFYSSRCHLTIEHEGGSFIGTLLFNDATMCQFIANMLKSHIGHSIKDIGDTDISYTL